MGKDLFNRVKTNFITGVAVLFPAFLTVIILKWVLTMINLWFLEPFVKFIRPYIDSAVVIFLLKLLVLFAILLIIMLCGLATRVILVKRFFGWGELLLSRMPFISKIYIGTKEVSAAIFGSKKGIFRKVVLIEFPRPGLFAVGFLTAEDIKKDIIKRPLDSPLASVFIPTTPNPTSGTFVFVQKKDIIEIDMSTEEALKMILSGGAILSNNAKYAAKK